MRLPANGAIASGLEGEPIGYFKTGLFFVLPPLKEVF